MSSLAVAAVRSADLHWEEALETLAEGRILAATAAAEALRPAARTDSALADRLVRQVVDGDALARLLALDALAWAPGREVEATLRAALTDPALAEQAAWALSRRAPVGAAVPGLVGLVAAGGFAAMPAQLALERWSRTAGREIRRAVTIASVEHGWSPGLVETLALTGSRAPQRISPPRRAPAGGLRVAQILLRGTVDAGLEAAGSGDGGGVVTLLVQLARELGRAPGIGESLIVARPRRDGVRNDETLGPGARIVRLPFGPSEDVAVSDMWRHRAQIERAVGALLAEHGRIDVAHLRYADAGTFAAARALRRAGVRVAFTLAPDPHALIAAREERGELTRESFAAVEPREHSLFRLRLVDDLAVRADRLVVLPRAGGRRALERLVGRPAGPGRAAVIPEGIAVEPLDRAAAEAESGESASWRVSRVLRLALDPARHDLPLIVSAGRFHPVKGFPRLVEAWAGDPELRSRFNLAIAGGALAQPTAEEVEVTAAIEAAAGRYPEALRGLALLGPLPHADVLRLLALCRHGAPGVAAPGGIYASGSAKEEFGVALLEAMGLGLPLVAPAAGGPATYVEPGVTGALVEFGADALRAGLHQAAALAADETCAARGVAVVRERFAIGAAAERLAGAYAQAAA
jgi:glycosyltransferase involved in cell wall biosynthesis